MYPVGKSGAFPGTPTGLELAPHLPTYSGSPQRPPCGLQGHFRGALVSPLEYPQT